MATIRQYANNNIVITEDSGAEVMIPTGVVPLKRGTTLYFVNSDFKIVKEVPVNTITAVTDRNDSTTNIDNIDTLFNTLRDNFFFRLTGTGVGGGTQINPNFVFTGAGTNATDFGPAEAARDAYFTANPTERVVGVLILLVNTFPDPDVAREQRWTGTEWVDIDTVLSGQQIEALYEARPNTNKYTDSDRATVQSLSTVTSGRIPVASGTNFIASSLTEETNDVVSDKAITTPPAEIRIGGVRLRNSADIIYLQSDLTNNRFFPCGSPFDNTGTGNPVCVNLDAEQDITAANQLINSDTITLNTDDVMSFTLTGSSSGVGDGRHVDRSFTVSALTSGTIRLELFVGTDDTGGLLVDQTVVLSSGLNTIELVSFPLIMVGQNYFVRYTAQSDNIQIRGTNSLGPVFIPFFTVRGWPYSLLEVIADVPNQFNTLGQKATPNVNDRVLIEDSEDNFEKKYVEIDDLPAGSGGSGAITVQDEGVSLTGNAETINFTGAGVTATGSGATKTVEIPGGAANITVQDEGNPLTSPAQVFNFVGSGVTATGTGSTKTINIPGGIGSLFSGVATFATQTGNFAITNLASTYYQTGTQITGLDISDSSIPDDLTFAVENELSSDLNLTLSGTGVSFAGVGTGTSFTIPSGEVVLFYVFTVGTSTIYPVSNYNVASGSAGSSANPVLTRDTPSLTELAAIADDSLNDNSGLWVVANDQISGTESGVDGSIQIRALKSGLLDANNTSIPTEPTAKSGVILQAGTIVRVFSNTDLRVVSTPTVREVAARYPDLPTSLIAGQVLNLVGQQVLYGIYRNRTAVIDINTSGFVEVRLPSLQNTFDLGYVNRNDVFCFRHAGTNGEVRVRTFQVGTFFSDGTETITLTPGQILCVSPAPSGAVWTIIELGQFTEITLDPLAMSDWYRDETDATAVDNFLRLHHRRDFVDGDIREHIVSVSSTNNPITVRFQSRNVQDDIAWISFWSTFVAGVPPVSTQSIDLAIIEIGQALTYIESNITAGQDFEFSDPVLGFVPIQAITFLTGTTLRIEFTTALPAHIVVNDIINVQNSSVAANNGSWAITAIAADRLDVEITIPGSSSANNTGNVGFFDRTIFADVTLVSNVLRQTNFNIYRDAGRTALITNYPQEWFATGISDTQTIFAIGYNGDIETRGSQIAIQDDTEDFFLVKGGPRRTIFSVDNLTTYSNTVTLPKNFEDIEIRTLGTANFLLREFPSELDQGEARRYHIHSHPDNDDDDVQVFIGESAAAPVNSDEGLNSFDVKNGTFVTIELYRTAFRSGWRIISPINRSITSGLIFSTAVGADTLTNNLLPVSLANVLVSQSEDPNRRFFQPGTPTNSVTLNATADYDFRLSVEIIYTGPAQTGLLFVPVGITTRVGPGGGTVVDDTRLSSNNQSLILARYTAQNASVVQSAITLEVDIVDYQGTDGDILQWRLDFGNLPPGIALSNFSVKDFIYTFTAKLRLD